MFARDNDLMDAPDPYIPDIVNEIIELIGQHTASYGGYLNWKERGRIQRDMMNDHARWSRVTPEALEAKCLAVGLKPEDAASFAEYLRKARAGRRLQPKYIPRDFRYFPDRPGE